MLAGIRRKISLRKLAKRGLAPHGLEPLRSLDDIQRVAFLIDGSAEQPFEFLMTYCQQLEIEGKEYTVCTFNGEKELPAFLMARPGVTVLQPKQTNWLYIPQRSALEGFLNQEYDYLVDLTQTEVLPLLWVKQWTRAKLRIGFDSESVQPNDLTIATGGSATIEVQMKLLEQYV